MGLEFAMPARTSVKSWVKTLQRKLWEINMVKCNTGRKFFGNCVCIVVEFWWWLWWDYSGNDFML